MLRYLACLAATTAAVHAAEWYEEMKIGPAWSNTFKDTFQNQPVASLTGDRAFIGNAWIGSLQAAGIPHFLRLREALRRHEDLHIFNDDRAPLPLPQHPARLKRGELFPQRLVVYWRLGKQRFAAGADRHSASRYWCASEHRQP